MHENPLYFCFFARKKCNTYIRRAVITLSYLSLVYKRLKEAEPYIIHVVVTEFLTNTDMIEEYVWYSHYY